MWNVINDWSDRKNNFLLGNFDHLWRQIKTNFDILYFKHDPMVSRSHSVKYQTHLLFNNGLGGS